MPRIARLFKSLTFTQTVVYLSVAFDSTFCQCFLFFLSLSFLCKGAYLWSGVLHYRFILSFGTTVPYYSKWLWHSSDSVSQTLSTWIKACITGVGWEKSTFVFKSYTSVVVIQKLICIQCMYIYTYSTSKLLVETKKFLFSE